MTKERKIEIEVFVNQNGRKRRFSKYTVMAKTQKEAIEKLSAELSLPFEILEMKALRSKRK